MCAVVVVQCNTMTNMSERGWLQDKDGRISEIWEREVSDEAIAIVRQAIAERKRAHPEEYKALDDAQRVALLCMEQRAKYEAEAMKLLDARQANPEKHPLSACDELDALWICIFDAAKM